MTCIYPTAPFVTAQKLKDAVTKLSESDADWAMPVTAYSFPPQRAMVIRDGGLEYQYPEYKNTRSQDLEPIYHDCGQFYACRTKPFLDAGTTDVENLLPLVLSEMEVQDIDTLEDWEIAEIKYRRLFQ